MVFTTIGAVAGPNLVNVTGEFALSIGVPSLAGPFLLAAVAYTLAGIILLLLLHPDPLLVVKQLRIRRHKEASRLLILRLLVMVEKELFLAL